MYCGDGQNEINKTIKYIVINCNVFYTVKCQIWRGIGTENNKIIIIILQNDKSTNKIINNLCIVGMATFKFYKKKLNT